jgi:hypothetical protein
MTRAELTEILSAVQYVCRGVMTAEQLEYNLRAQLAALPPDPRDEALEEIEKELSGLNDFGPIKHREDHMEVCFDWCPKCRVERALAAIARAKGGTRE